ncbi:Snapin/Pallidin-domain-containing protein [Glomus cerebriforme]|uniref:Biogenesis of lysosome-related organelles complex 1 subunit 7 n=1 Tax=Glomus cerebriforme TaxID=658196 RepID=A0A397TAG1_9GLOM|nr:Snapin/Pallidin-domain-containing protein [Glomus cerebriforme]
MEQEEIAPSVETINITDNDVNLDKEKFSKGLMTLLTPVIEEMDSRIVAVKASQKELNKEIERLLAELQLFVEATESPPIQPSIQKLVTARKKLTTTNQTLKTVHDRIERMYAQLSKETTMKRHSFF